MGAVVGTPPERAVVQFAIDGELQSVEPLGRGHIHRTWCSRFRGPAGERRFVHQRINRAVFEQPDRVMDNIARVTGHLRRKFREAGSDPTRRTLTIVPARDGSPLLRTIDGEYWRTYRYIDHASTFDAPRDEAHVFQVGQAFATFLRMLADLEGPPLYETIRRFGDTRLRFERFVDVTNRDPLGRAGAVADEIAFVRRRERLAALVVELIAAGAVPRRVAHHDTKINNVLIDDATDEGICVIDLDTVMAGTVLYDFG
ncbi:MAG TPA: phosphotransferase, partial [Candidatus Polarisedimenticolaceae bacterium]|nr:phosphotransferase [Candidatus Polarisedimenticolaceae bacterium]